MNDFAQYDRVISRLEETADRLQRDLAAVTAERDELLQRYQDRTAERDRWMRQHDIARAALAGSGGDQEEASRR